MISLCLSSGDVEPIISLQVRAYDLGIPSLDAEVPVNIFTQVKYLYQGVGSSGFRKQPFIYFSLNLKEILYCCFPRVKKKSFFII